MQWHLRQHQYIAQPPTIRVLAYDIITISFACSSQFLNMSSGIHLGYTSWCSCWHEIASSDLANMYYSDTKSCFFFISFISCTCVQFPVVILGCIGFNLCFVYLIKVQHVKHAVHLTRYNWTNSLLYDVSLISTLLRHTFVIQITLWYMVVTIAWCWQFRFVPYTTHIVPHAKQFLSFYRLHTLSGWNCKIHCIGHMMQLPSTWIKLVL